MVLAVDASVTLSWAYEDETTPYSEGALDAMWREGAVVPMTWTLEVANALLIGERRGRITPSVTTRFSALLSSSPIEVDGLTADRVWQSTVDLARRFSLTVYDASYLELALRTGARFATLDHRLEAAAVALGIDLFAVEEGGEER